MDNGSATQSSNWARFFLTTAWLLPCLGILLNSFPLGAQSFMPAGTGYLDSGRTLLSVLCFLGFLFSSPSPDRPRSKAGILAIAFLIWSLLSSLLHEAWLDSLLFWQLWPAAAMFFAAARRFGPEAVSLGARTTLVHLPLAVIAGTALLPILHEPVFLRIGGVFDLAGVLANWLLLLLPICLYDALEQKNLHAVAAATASVLGLVAVGYSFSRASWFLVCLELGLILLLIGRFEGRRLAVAAGWILLSLGTLVGLKKHFSTSTWALSIVLALALPTLVETVKSRVHKRHLVRLLAVLAAAAVLGWGLSTTESMQSAQEVTGQRLEKLKSYDNSSRARVQLWKAAADMSLDHPILGVGPGEFSVYYPRFQKLFYYYSDSAHSAALEMSSETGLVGLALFCGSLLLLFWEGLRRPISPLQRSALLALFCGLGYAQIDLAYQFGYLWLTIAMVCLFALSPVEQTTGESTINIPQGILALIAVGITMYLVPPLREVEMARRLSDEHQALSSYQRGAERLPWWRHALLSSYQLQLQLELTPNPEQTQSLLALGDETPAAHAMVGEWHLEGKRFQEAVREYRRAVELDPFNHPNYYAKLRQLGIQLGDRELVQISSRAILENYPLDKVSLAPPGHREHLQAELQPALLDLADAMNPYRQPKRTEPIYRFLYEYNPTPRAAYGLGISLQTMGRREEAIPYLEEAHRKNPIFPAP